MKQKCNRPFKEDIMISRTLLPRFSRFITCCAGRWVVIWPEYHLIQVLAATQTPGEKGLDWFQGTADAVRQYLWLFEVHLFHFNSCPLISLSRKGNVPLPIYTVEASCELIVFLAATGCEEQGCGECADPIWGSSLPSGLHGLRSGLHLPLLLNWLLKTIPITFFEFELVKSIMQIYVIILLDKGYRMWTILAVRSKFSGWKQYWWLSWSRLWGWMSLTFWICFWVMFFRSIRTVVLISQFHVCQWTTGNHFRSIVATMLMQICCNFFASFIWKLWWTGCRLYWL